MTGQHFVFLETISGMKRALSRADDASDSDETIRRSTNRASKLKKNSRYAQEGRLDTNYGVCAQRKRIEHAGYKRTIISRNPSKYDHDGDEVPDYEDDGTLDTSAMEENPYEDIRLEHLLAPLTSAADLPTHPSLAYPFYSKNITEMARIAEETLQRERAYLHRIKRLFTKFRGDEHWAPCGIMEPDFVSTASQRSIRDREQHPPQSRGTAGDGATEGALRPVTENGTDDMIDPNAQAAEPLKILHKHVEAEKENNLSSHANVIEKGLNSTEQANQDLDAGTKDLIKDTEEIVQTNDDSAISKSSANLSPSKDAEEVTSKGESSRSQLQEGNDPSKGIADANVEAAKTYKSNLPSPPAEEEEGEMNPTPSSPRQQQQQQLLLQRRVVTRAQTHAKSKTPTPPTSNTPTLFKNATANGAVGIEQKTGEEFVPDVHPFFTIPASAIPNRDMNLPPYQADEIRRQLLLWVQKQEEVVRGAEELCYGLLRADRMRNDVLRWTKAEGHLHEMSDGEDWYDREEWGLEEDLVKGKEEDDDETTATAKKTRHRRADR